MTSGSGGGGVSSSSSSRVTPEEHIPLNVKARALEDAAYADLARLAGAYAITASRWNANPELSAGLVVVRARETLPVQPTAAPVAASAGPLAMHDEGAATSWRTLHYRADAEAPAGLRVMVVTDSEADAAAAWEAAVAVKGGAAPRPPTAPALDDAPLLAASESAQVAQLPSFRATLEFGTSTRNSAIDALQARTSAEGLDVISRSSPLFVSAIEALFRLLRPLSFTRWGSSSVPRFQ